MADVVDLIKAQHRAMDDLLEQAQQAEPDRVRELLQQVADMLLPHSQAEESFVYPAIREYDASEDAEVKDGTAEHHHIEALMRELLTEDPSGPGFDGKLAAMVAELRHHVEEEEQDLLPVLSEKADDDEREELGTRFAEETGNGLGAAATRDELYEEARRQDVPGRSSMTKAELAEAVENP
jgi:hemerythrin superfamily protein